MGAHEKPLPKSVEEVAAKFKQEDSEMAEFLENILDATPLQLTGKDVVQVADQFKAARAWLSTFKKPDQV